MVLFTLSTSKHVHVIIRFAYSKIRQLQYDGIFVLMTESYGSSIFQTEFQRYLPVHKKWFFILDLMSYIFITRYKLMYMQNCVENYFFNLMCIMIVYFKSTKDNVQITMKSKTDL